MRLRKGDVVLPPAGWWIGRGPARVRTLLGSCVSITAWHERTQTGAICHCLLPAADVGGDGDPRYVDSALRLMTDALKARGIAAETCQWKLFGGARMFRTEAQALPDIGQRNIAAAEALLQAMGCAPVACDVGGPVHREIVFDLRTGSVWSRRAPPVPLGASQ